MKKAFKPKSMRRTVDGAKMLHAGLYRKMAGAGGRWHLYHWPGALSEVVILREDDELTPDYAPVISDVQCMTGATMARHLVELLQLPAENAAGMEAWLHHKSGDNGPFSTESVPVKVEQMAHHKNELQYTATGYGSRIPTEYMVKWRGRWRRVYCRIWSNVGTLYIRVPDAYQGRIVVNIERVEA